MATLTVDGIVITLSATENAESNKYTLTGKYDSKLTGKNFDFKVANDPKNPKYNDNAIEIVTSTKSTSSIHILSSGHPKDVWVWHHLTTNDSDTGGGDPVTPRGTEVEVSGDDETRN